MMLKTIGRSIFIGLITQISAIILAPSAHASTDFCNQTNSQIQVAYARGTFDPRPSIEITSYKVKGWLKISPGACMTASTEPADKIDRPDGSDRIRHYYYAKFVNKKIALTSKIFQHTEKFCIKNASFQYAGEIDPASPKSKCDQGYKPVEFITFNSNTPNYTVSLTSSQNLPPAIAN
ncbi:DUF1036 domain-containing protein [Chamaesiphon sp. VAR_48_metabat_135_sub]|uniref:DUF1036 domain-containing protein n=1 Tax=Chamaesiphon sp. VAR_48_metabat_135_sub TaxID=2964699 RepID=UPI00286B5538|nr:DUF1036 domain-containing protein [Chamaesiphon sp. VAR_48_metabat_135_sub]